MKKSRKEKRRPLLSQKTAVCGRELISDKLLKNQVQPRTTKLDYSAVAAAKRELDLATIVEIKTAKTTKCKKVEMTDAPPLVVTKDYFANQITRSRPDSSANHLILH